MLDSGYNSNRKEDLNMKIKVLSPFQKINKPIKINKIQ